MDDLTKIYPWIDFAYAVNFDMIIQTGVVIWIETVVIHEKSSRQIPELSGPKSGN